MSPNSLAAPHGTLIPSSPRTSFVAVLWTHSSTLLLLYLNPPPKLQSCVLVLTEVVEDSVDYHSAHSVCLLRLYLCFPLPCSNQVGRQHLLNPQSLVSQHSTQSSPSQLFSALYYLYFSGYVCTPLPLLLVTLVCLPLTHIDDRQLQSNSCCRPGILFLYQIHKEAIALHPLPGFADSLFHGQLLSIVSAASNKKDILMSPEESWLLCPNFNMVLQ